MLCTTLDCCAVLLVSLGKPSLDEGIGVLCVCQPSVWQAGAQQTLIFGCLCVVDWWLVLGCRAVVWLSLKPPSKRSWPSRSLMDSRWVWREWEGAVLTVMRFACCVSSGIYFVPRVVWVTHEMYAAVEIPLSFSAAQSRCALTDCDKMSPDALHGPLSN